MSRRRTAALGVFAVLWFWACLFGFAAVRADGYSHLTKAVSELGVVGAPNMLAWNIVGFGVTGAKLAVFGWRFGRAVEPERRSPAGWLAASGAAFAATAVPADMDALSSPGSLAHIGASLLVFVCWLPAAWGFARGRGGRTLATVSTVALWAALAAVLIRVAGVVPPGLGQRLSFAIYFGWVLAAAVVLWRSAANQRSRVSDSV